jgi:hypothetical protein
LDRYTLLEEFGHDEYDGQMSKLMQLRQSGSVSEYRQTFEDFVYHLLAVDKSLSTRWFVSHLFLVCEMTYELLSGYKLPRALHDLLPLLAFRKKSWNIIVPEHVL